MPLLRPLSDNTRRILRITFLVALIGALHGHSIAVANGAPLWSVNGLLRGFLTGAFIAVVLATFDILAEARATMAPLLRASFLVHVVVKSALYLVVILFGLAAGAWLLPAPKEAGLRFPVERGDVLFAVAVALAFNFVLDISRLLGQNVLINFVTGRYHRPRLEERVFLFIDMQGSTTLAERLGELAFHRLVNRFVIDLTEPIVAASGEIHRYVGDELIATWKLADGVADAHCVRACFDALDRLAALAPDYVREFGSAVNCRAGIHCGPVVTGEMGSIKREIVFLGDTVNTTARIQEMCRTTGHRVLASAALIDRMELPPEIAKRSLGDLRLRGKEHDVVLYALEKRGAATAAASEQRARAGAGAI